MTSKRIYMTEFNAAETDSTCGMRYWNNQIEAGKGVIHMNEVLLTLQQQALHLDLRTLASMKDIRPGAIEEKVQDVLSQIPKDDKSDLRKLELLYRRLGWFVGFALFVEPRLRTLYETLDVDSEILLDADPLVVVVRPDRILKSRSTGEIIYREYAPMPPDYFNKNWLNAWTYNPRLHVGMAAAEQVLTSVITYGQMFGFSEGYISTIDGRLCHPYVWSYHNIVTDEWSHHVRSGEEWKSAPVWEQPRSLIDWVQELGTTVADKVFCLSQPVKLERNLVDEWTARRIHREREIHVQRDTCQINLFKRSIHFPKHMTQCVTREGKSCQYTALCWNHNVQLNPIESKLYIPNVLTPPAVAPIDIVEAVVVDDVVAS